MRTLYIDIQRVFKIFLNILVCFSLISFPINVFNNTEKVYATNVLTNPSFTGVTTGWTLSTMTYVSGTFQDTAGSVQTTAGRNATATGTATQNSYVNISTGSIITFSGWWRTVRNGNGNIQLFVEIAEQNTPNTWITIWESGTITSTVNWTLIDTEDVSSYFSSGSYRLRLRIIATGGAAGGSSSTGGFDNLNLDVTVPNITVGTTGTQITNIHQGAQNVYVGGAFTFLRDVGSTTITSISISNTGTISSSHLSGLILYYKEESNCSSSIPTDATQFNNTPGTFSSGTSTVTGSMSVGTNQVCMYVELDVSSDANIGDTIEIQITNPSTQVVTSSGTVFPSSPVSINGTTTIDAMAIVSISIETDGDIDYGILPATESKSTIDLSDTQTIKNTGNVNINLSVKSTNAIGGTSWILGNNYGSDIFVHEYSSNSGSVWNKFLVADQYYTLTTGLEPLSTQNVDFRITVPSLTTDYLEKNITITILATEST